MRSSETRHGVWWPTLWMDCRKANRQRRVDIWEHMKIRIMEPRLNSRTSPQRRNVQDHFIALWGALFKGVASLNRTPAWRWWLIKFVAGRFAPSFLTLAFEDKTGNAEKPSGRWRSLPPFDDLACPRVTILCLAVARRWVGWSDKASRWWRPSSNAPVGEARTARQRRELTGPCWIWRYWLRLWWGLFTKHFAVPTGMKNISPYSGYNHLRRSTARLAWWLAWHSAFLQSALKRYRTELNRHVNSRQNRVEECSPPAV